MSSDHSPILLTLSETILLKEYNPTLVNKNTDWESFKIDLESMIDLRVPLKKPEDLDWDISEFITQIQQCAWKNTPTFKIKNRITYYPAEITKLIAEKRRQR